MRTPVVVGALYDPERSQVAGEGRLVDHNALLSQQLLELFMPLDPMGIEELHRAYRDNRLDLSDFEGSRFIRLKTLQDHMTAGDLDAELFWTERHAASRTHANASSGHVGFQTKKWSNVRTLPAVGSLGRRCASTTVVSAASSSVMTARVRRWPSRY